MIGIDLVWSGNTWITAVSLRTKQVPVMDVKEMKKVYDYTKYDGVAGIPIEPLLLIERGSAKRKFNANGGGLSKAQVGKGFIGNSAKSGNHTRIKIRDDTMWGFYDCLNNRFQMLATGNMEQAIKAMVCHRPRPVKYYKKLYKKLELFKGYEAKIVEWLIEYYARQTHSIDMHTYSYRHSNVHIWWDIARGIPNLSQEKIHKLIGDNESAYSHYHYSGLIRKFYGNAAGEKYVINLSLLVCRGVRSSLHFVLCVWVYLCCRVESEWHSSEKCTADCKAPDTSKWICNKSDEQLVKDLDKVDPSVRSFWAHGIFLSGQGYDIDKKDMLMGSPTLYKAKQLKETFDWGFQWPHVPKKSVIAQLKHHWGKKPSNDKTVTKEDVTPQQQRPVHIPPLPLVSQPQSAAAQSDHESGEDDDDADVEDSKDETKVNDDNDDLSQQDSEDDVDSLDPTPDVKQDSEEEEDVDIPMVPLEPKYKPTSPRRGKHKVKSKDASNANDDISVNTNVSSESELDRNRDKVESNRDKVKSKDVSNATDAISVNNNRVSNFDSVESGNVGMDAIDLFSITTDNNSLNMNENSNANANLQSTNSKQLESLKHKIHHIHVELCKFKGESQTENCLYFISHKGVLDCIVEDLSNMLANESAVVALWDELFPLLQLLLRCADKATSILATQSEMSDILHNEMNERHNVQVLDTWNASRRKSETQRLIAELAELMTQAVLVTQFTVTTEGRGFQRLKSLMTAIVDHGAMLQSRKVLITALLDYNFNHHQNS